MDKGDLASNNRIEQLRKLFEIAWSDGIMTDQESAFILQKAKEFGVPVDIVVALNAEVKQSLQPIPDHVLLEMRTLIELAMVDGHLSTQEEELIKNKGLIYNLSDTQIKTLIGEIHAKLQGKISPNVVPNQVIEEKPRRSRSEIIQELKKSVVRIECGDSNGAGVVVHRRGIVITNHHVTPEELSSGISIQFSDDDKTRWAFLIKSIPEIDIAFLGIDVDNERELPVAKLGNASYVSEGDRVFAIGHPMGLTYTVTDGIISAKKRLWNDIGYFQTNADINPGNSGGPLCNEQGEVVGINTFVITGTQGLNFALPVHYVEHEIEKIADNYEMHKGNFVVRMLDNIRSTLYSEGAVRALMQLGILHFTNIADVGDLRIISGAEQVYRALQKEYRNNPKDYDAFKCAVPQYNAVELLRFIALSLGRLNSYDDKAAVSRNMAALSKNVGVVYFILLEKGTQCDPRLSLSAKAFFERLQTGEHLADLRKEQGLAPKKWWSIFSK